MHDVVRPVLMSTKPEYPMTRPSPTANWTYFCAGTSVDQTKNVVLRLLYSSLGPLLKLPMLMPSVYGGLPPVQVMLEGTHSVSESATLIWIVSDWLWTRVNRAAIVRRRIDEARGKCRRGAMRGEGECLEDFGSV